MPPFLITMFIKIVEQLCPKNKSKVGHPIKYETEIYLNLIFRRMRTGIQWNEFQKLNIIGPEYSGIYTPQFFTIICEYPFYNMIEDYKLTIGEKN